MIPMNHSKNTFSFHELAALLKRQWRAVAIVTLSSSMAAILLSTLQAPEYPFVASIRLGHIGTISPQKAGLIESSPVVDIGAIEDFVKGQYNDPSSGYIKGVDFSKTETGQWRALVAIRAKSVNEAELISSKLEISLKSNFGKNYEDFVHEKQDHLQNLTALIEKQNDSLMSLADKLSHKQPLPELAIALLTQNEIQNNILSARREAREIQQILEPRYTVDFKLLGVWSPSRIASPRIFLMAIAGAICGLFLSISYVLAFKGRESLPRETTKNKGAGI